MISHEQLKKLQNLAAIELADDEVEEFQDSLSNIITYLNKLQDIQIKDDVGVWLIKSDNWMNGWVTWNFMQTREGVVNHDDTEALIANVEHEVVGNSVTIKSFVK